MVGARPRGTAGAHAGSFVHSPGGLGEPARPSAGLFPGQHSQSLGAPWAQMGAKLGTSTGCASEATVCPLLVGSGLRGAERTPQAALPISAGPQEGLP